MAGDFSHRIVYRKDERGVILDSTVVGPDDELPEGFEESAEYHTYLPTEQEAEPIAESKLTTWEGLDLSQNVDAIKNTAEEQEGPSDPGGLRESGEIKGKQRATVEGTVKRTDEVVVPPNSTDDPMVGADAGSDQTIDEVKDSVGEDDEGAGQEGPSDPRGESSEKDGEDGDKPATRRGRSNK